MISLFLMQMVFQNVLGEETWLEWWQGVDAEGCGIPVYPHDGSNPATWVFDDETGRLTLMEVWDLISVYQKLSMQAELTSNVDVPESVTYNVYAR